MLNFARLFLPGIFIALFANAANATLGLRDGGKMVYDSDQNITWLTDFKSAGYAQNWADAEAWVSSLNVDGYTGWRLPTTDAEGWSGICTYAEPTGEICGFKPPASSSELAALYYSILGNAGYPDPAWGLKNTGPFANLLGVFWSATEDGPDKAWVFGTNGGDQGPNPKTYLLYAEAVRNGDVGALAVPEPGTVALSALAFVALLSQTRRKESI